MSINWRPIIYRIPILGSLSYFPWSVHREGLKKFFYLWVFASLPIIFSVLFAAVPEGDGHIFNKFMSEFSGSITISEHFVYAASFIAPLLYIGVNRYESIEDGEGFSGKVTEVRRSVFKGYSLLFALGIFVILSTGMVFASAKTDTNFLRDTFIFEIVSSISLWLYFFALLCWYLAMLDDIHSMGGFAEKSQESSNEVKQGLSARLNKRGQ